MSKRRQHLVRYKVTHSNTTSITRWNQCNIKRTVSRSIRARWYQKEKKKRRGETVSLQTEHVAGGTWYISTASSGMIGNSTIFIICQLVQWKMSLEKKVGERRYRVQERDTRPVHWVGPLRVSCRGAPCAKNMERI